MSSDPTIRDASSIQQANSIVPVGIPHESYVEQSSWEYLMPKRRVRAAGYPRNSDENLKNSPTLESQAKAIRDYCRKEGYGLTDDHMYPEAISAYLVHYSQRPKLMELIAAACGASLGQQRGVVIAPLSLPLFMQRYRNHYVSLDAVMAIRLSQQQT